MLAPQMPAPDMPLTPPVWPWLRFAMIWDAVMLPVVTTLPSGVLMSKPRRLIFNAPGA